MPSGKIGQAGSSSRRAPDASLARIRIARSPLLQPPSRSRRSMQPAAGGSRAEAGWVQADVHAKMAVPMRVAKWRVEVMDRWDPGEARNRSEERRVGKEGVRT